MTKNNIMILLQENTAFCKNTKCLYNRYGEIPGEDNGGYFEGDGTCSYFKFKGIRCTEEERIKR